jgi:hypothetical protein
MKSADHINADQIWDHLLSRQPDLIMKAFQQLNTTDKKNVILHLQRMISESGWHEEQKISAEIALTNLKRINTNHKE